MLSVRFHKIFLNDHIAQVYICSGKLQVETSLLSVKPYISDLDCFYKDKKNVVCKNITSGAVK